MIDQACRLSELKDQLEAQSSAAAAPRKAVSELADMQPYSASKEELHEVLAQAKWLSMALLMRVNSRV